VKGREKIAGNGSFQEGKRILSKNACTNTRMVGKRGNFSRLIVFTKRGESRMTGARQRAPWKWKITKKVTTKSRNYLQREDGKRFALEKRVVLGVPNLKKRTRGKQWRRGLGGGERSYLEKYRIKQLRVGIVERRGRAGSLKRDGSDSLDGKIMEFKGAQ